MTMPAADGDGTRVKTIVTARQERRAVPAMPFSRWNWHICV
jgi:hypothetical protein